MSALLIDVGNTRLKWALCERGEFLRQGSFVTDWPKLVEQFNAQWGNWFEQQTPKKIVISNVVGKRLTTGLQHWLEARAEESTGLKIELVSAKIEAFGVRCAYAQPAQLGADRWAALVAARHLVEGACCVIDAGTALTIDVLDANGVHLGGVIAPGLAMMRQSLAQNTAQVDAEEIVTASLFSVRDTAGAVQAGIMAAVSGAIQQALQQCREQGLGTPVCVLTGGDAQHLSAAVPSGSRVDADWVLKGLAIISGESQRTDA